MPKNTGAVLGELQRRWQQIFEALASGGEVPPALRLRTEGMMELAAMLDIASEDELWQAMAGCYESALGRPLPDEWRDLFPFPQVPGFGKRAPVYPST